MRKNIIAAKEQPEDKNRILIEIFVRKINKYIPCGEYIYSEELSEWGWKPPENTSYIGGYTCSSISRELDKLNFLKKTVGKNKLREFLSNWDFKESIRAEIKQSSV